MTTGYDKQLTDHLELTFASGYLSSGGEAAVNRMVQGVSLAGAEVLDFGSGLGAVSRYLLGAHGAAHIVGVDVEAHMIERSRQCAGALGLADRLAYHLIKPDAALDFAERRFDVIYSKESILHVRDKALIFGEFLRCLKPGGTVVLVDWILNASVPYDPETERFLTIDGLAFHMTGLDEYRHLLTMAGFRIEREDDRSTYVLAETVAAIDKIRTELQAVFAERFSATQIDDYLTSWTLQESLLRRGILKIHQFRGVKP